ncbi:putative bifunctional diguanylate cyclase/phosphodiesterase [Paludibacterium denitrificans]|uniref:putative bifunctional diguanylate cyclase/phosphodiesterase n=1 Tax=Paludibacterium denitrificans TaxID=2675226 RepID=UPI001E37FA7E|nr:diguanylate cyclase [Paludibacterium denitrificans]
MSKCNNALIRAEDEQGLLSTICRLAVETGGYRMAWVGFAQHDASRSVRPMAQSGYEEGYLDGMAVSWADTPLGQGPTGTAIRTGHTTVNQNVLTNPKMLPWRELAVRRGYQSSIALPLIVNSRVLGALTIYAAEASAFNAGEVELLEELANNLAYGIQTLRTRIQHQAAEKKLEFLAHYDPLTGLPNRRLLQDRFNQAATVAKREHSTVAVLFLDLDNFKQVNDSLGHGCGDRLLVQVAQRLQGCIRASDTISRQGGDEFVILLHDVPEVVIVEEITRGIVDAFAESFSVDSYTLNTSFSIGISLFPDDDSDLNTLLKHADTALYHAKEAQKHLSLLLRANEPRCAGTHAVARPIAGSAKKQLVLHYQPQIDAVSGQIIGAEALLRWQHPQWGLLGPGRFIGLAERSGLIIPIGEWVLNEACRQAEEWRQMNLPSPIAVAVNLSALQFKRGNLVETVSRALAQSGLLKRACWSWN